jgi:putative transposase
MQERREMSKKRQGKTFNISEKMQELLKKFAKSRTLPFALVKRSRIVLMASAGENNREIAKEVDLHHINVATWKNRFFLEAQPVLEALEMTETDKEEPNYSKLEEELRIVLSDKPRPGIPSTITAEEVIKIMNLACQNPEDHGYEVSHWTHVLLAEAAVKTGIVDEISRSSIGRFLKDSRYSPS